MRKKKILFVITQFYKGGAEVSLLNLFKMLPQNEYDVDFLIFDQMILPNATSLIPYIPQWIHVCNAAEKEGYLAVVFKALAKIYRKLTKRQLYRREAYNFVKNKKYDLAISFGEWLSPEFVAKKVVARKKAIWIHTDIDKASYVDPSILFGYNEFYSKYIFVSEASMRSAMKRFSILNDNNVSIVHNMCDLNGILDGANKKIKWDYSEPVLVSIGNIRLEKNYSRAIDVMRELRNRDCQVKWLIIGSTANKLLYQQLKRKIEKYNLTSYFEFLGAKKNPYPYIKNARALILLSDFESWSMVITEAKILNTFVITTDTSGAKEQIKDGVNGYITSFDVMDIADKIEKYLERDIECEKNDDNRIKIQGLSEFKQLIEELKL